jgi:glycosyltransferase involved in cell wall biosynthesis
MPTTRRDPIRVLVVAETCHPLSPSGPLIAYQRVRALAARPDLRVTLAAHDRNREAHRLHPIPGLAGVRYIDTEWLTVPIQRFCNWCRGGATLGLTLDAALHWPAHILFEKKVYREFAGQLRRGDFDLVHRLHPYSPTVGSPLACLTDVPVVIGPLNGGLPWPKQYPGLRRREREWLAPLRGAYRFLPYARSTYRHAAAVIAGSRHTATEVPAWFRGLRFYEADNGIDPARFPIAERWPEPEPGGRFRFITVGRVVPFKAMDLVIEAMGGSDRLRSCELEVVGDGPMRPQLEAQVARLGLGGNVTFAGWLDQGELSRRLARAQAFVFPSLREFGGGVVLEAMANGLPSVLVDYGGPPEMGTPDCALLLPLTDRGSLVPAVRAAMERLAGDHGLCRSLGEAAARRVREHFTWDVKTAKIVGMYEQVLASRGLGPARLGAREAAPVG